jgi:Protein of unknown function (DUF1279)
MEFMRLMNQRVLRQALQSQPSVVRQSFRQISRSSQQPFRSRTSPVPTISRAVRSQQSSPFSHQFRRKIPRRFQSTQAGTSDANLSLSQRLRKLSREYGWSALGIYLLLSALDFPFCFLAVRSLGTDRIGHWEHVILSYIKSAVKWPLSESAQNQVDSAVEIVKEKGPLDERGEGEKRMLEEDETYMVQDHGYKEAEKAASKADASALISIPFTCHMLTILQVSGRS